VNPERADPRGAKQRRAWQHLVCAAKLPIVGLGVNRISMIRSTFDGAFGYFSYGSVDLSTLTVATSMMTSKMIF
jgi:hypothetical protein